MRSKLLPELCVGLNIQKSLPGIHITGLALDSREVRPNYLFLAYPGTQTDGRNYIVSAIQNGALVIIYEEIENQLSAIISDFPKIIFIPIKHLQKHIAHIAANFYDYPAKELKIIGVTGTNGKTSCTHFIAQCLNWHGNTCAVIGTLGNGFINALDAATHTTPNPIELQKLLADYLAKGATHVAMEVSSHSLEQERVAEINFEVAVLTNLTRDHLDYHQSMENYANAKRKLFAFSSVKTCILNGDDDFGLTLINEFSTLKTVYVYTHERQSELPNETLLISASHTNFSAKGISATLNTPWGTGLLHSTLLGKFNLSNLLAVFTAILHLGVPFESSLDYLSRLQSVPGRMQMLGGDQQPLIIVDYAHTPDALEKLLVTSKTYCTGKLWCVFGCGGDRDKGKRSVMGKIAENYADVVIVTDDNPRHENSADIIAEILSGMIAPKNAIVEHDRKRAIEHALNSAKQDDIILIAGKGHETYQQIGDEKYPFNDFVLAKLWLANEKNS